MAQFHSPVDDVLATLSKSRNVIVVVPNYNQIAVVLAHSECVATLPSPLLKRYSSTIDILELPFDIPPFNLAMAWPPRAQSDHGHRWSGAETGRAHVSTPVTNEHLLSRLLLTKNNATHVNCMNSYAVRD